MKINNQQLKQKTFEFFVDIISIGDFEKYLYKLVENAKLDSNSLLFDLIDINYKSENYKKELLNLIEDICSDEELLSFKIYSLCLSIISSADDNIILKSISDLSDLFIEFEYESSLLYEFFFLNNNQIPDDYNLLNEEQIIVRAKSYSEKVIAKFNDCKMNESWDDFLYFAIEEEEIKIDNKIIDSYIPLTQNENFVTKLMNLIKGILGLR